MGCVSVKRSIAHESGKAIKTKKRGNPLLNYFLFCAFAQESRKATVRLNTGLSGVESGS